MVPGDLRPGYTIGAGHPVDADADRRAAPRSSDPAARGTIRLRCGPRFVHESWIIEISGVQVAPDYDLLIHRPARRAFIGTIAIWAHALAMARPAGLFVPSARSDRHLE